MAVLAFTPSLQKARAHLLFKELFLLLHGFYIMALGGFRGFEDLNLTLSCPVSGRKYF
jgi:hypothetical protein